MVRTCGPRLTPAAGGRQGRVRTVRSEGGESRCVRPMRQIVAEAPENAPVAHLNTVQGSRMYAWTTLMYGRSVPISAGPARCTSGRGRVGNFVTPMYVWTLRMYVWTTRMYVGSSSVIDRTSAEYAGTRSIGTLDFLTALGHDVEIRVKRTRKPHGQMSVVVAA